MADDDMTRPSVAVIILTHNEDIHLQRALRSVAPFAAEVFVIDAHSTDRTVEIARQNGAKVLSNGWTNYATQFAWGMANAPIAADWILRLDADEIIEPDLAARIGRDLATLPADIVGINIDRKHIFMDRWIRHGGRYPLTLLRLFKRGHGRIEQRWMDEHIVIAGGRSMHWSGGFADHNLKGLGFFIDKHNGYATREAIDRLNQRHGLFPRDLAVSTASASRQTAFRRLAKERVFNRLPFALAAAAYFIFRYVCQRGFLDGREGLVYHVLQGFWYRFLVGAKVMEFERALSSCVSAEDKRARLRALTGLPL